MSDIGKAAGNTVQGIKKLAHGAAHSTKRLGRIAHLNLNIADEKKNIKHLYTDIGRLYYEAHRDDPEGFFVQLFQQLDASMENLEAMEAELGGLKAGSAPVETAAEEPAAAGGDAVPETDTDDEAADAGEADGIEVEIIEEE